MNIYDEDAEKLCDFIWNAMGKEESYGEDSLNFKRAQRKMLSHLDDMRECRAELAIKEDVAAIMGRDSVEWLERHGG